MPFRFRLKPLMKHREFKLTAAQAALGAAEAVRMEIQSKIDSLHEDIRAECLQFEEEQEKGIEAGRYLNFKNHLNFMERELLLLFRELEKASEEVELLKQAMIECDKSVKVLENMETSDRECYKLLQTRKEQKKLDDVAVFKDYRDRNGKGGEQ
ncbi:MAG: flagellar export protein FliJ [Syntrophobacteraceae bacterium]